MLYYIVYVSGCARERKTEAEVDIQHQAQLDREGIIM